MPCGRIKAVINFNGSLVRNVEPIKIPTLKPLNSRFIKVDKPKVIAPDSIKKITFKLFNKIVGKLNCILGLKLGISLLLIFDKLFIDTTPRIKPIMKIDIVSIGGSFFMVSQVSVLRFIS